jgi:hypothetical protein
MKTILSIIPYELTIHDFFILRDPLKERPCKHFFRSIPEWCVRNNNGCFDYTENYHQFTGLMDDNSDEIFYLFDINPVDLELKENISNIGIERVFDGYDWRPLFKKIPTNVPPGSDLRIPFSVHVVVDLDYTSLGDGDYDMVVMVLGFLDNQMNLSII